MKMKRILPLFLGLFCSCSTLVRYSQVVTLGSEELMQDKSDAFYYEENDIRITYNFSGNTFCFFVQNLGKDDIEVDLSRSFLGINGIAFDYYMEKTVTYSTSHESSSTLTSVSANGSSSTVSDLTSFGSAGFSYRMNYDATASALVSEHYSSDTDGYSVSYKALPISIIPNGQGKIYCEFPVMYSRYESSKLEDYPQDAPVSVTFDKEGSPMKFVNRIMIVRNGVDCPVSNDFYVSGITNTKSELMRDVEIVTFVADNGYTDKQKIYGPNKYASPKNAIVDYSRYEKR